MNISHLQLFVRLAAIENISQAGHTLGLSPAVASNYINKLEQSLGVRLFHRTTRQVTLTEDGKDFLPYAEDVLASVDAARAAVGADFGSPAGTLRVTAPASFGRMHLLPALPAFMETFPDIHLDLRLSDSIVDMVEGGFDVAIRDAELKDSSLVARKLATDRRIVCASPSYIENFGRPSSPRELREHHCVTLIGLENWFFTTPNGPVNVKARGKLRTDNGEAMRDACIDGLGLAVNSIWSVYEHLKRGKLVQVLEDFPLMSDTAIWAVYPSARQLAPKVRAFIDFFADHFGPIPYWEDGLESNGEHSA